MRTIVATLLLAALAGTAHARVNDFPTRARVDYVLTCMKGVKAPLHEAMYKCSCAVDYIASKIDYRTYVDMSTIADAITIAGERGGVMRDLEGGRKTAAQLRALKERANKACFIDGR